MNPPAPQQDKKEVMESWPIRPRHITDIRKNGDMNVLSEELKKLTEQGILSHFHLQGIQLALYEKLGYPTAIIEFSPDGEPIWTDSRSIMDLMSPACMGLRQSYKNRNQPDRCADLDGCAAKQFWAGGGMYAAPKQAQKAVAGASCSDCQLPHHAFNVKERTKDWKTRHYIEYDCPALGYRELAFPLSLNKGFWPSISSDRLYFRTAMTRSRSVLKPRLPV